MKIDFTKYQGTGNDFIMVDNRSGYFPHDTHLVSSLCDRKFGIGADGLILIQNRADVDFEMIYFNADGSQSLCGNGSRCAVNFAHDLGIIATKATFQTIDGPLSANIETTQVCLRLNDQPAPTDHGDHFFLHNGSPHHIVVVDNADQCDVYELGKSIRYSKTYEPAGTNVNFVEIKPSSIYVRTYERGVEDETLSCGTGVMASALAAALTGLESPISVATKGGQLSVRFERTQSGGFLNIWLIGPAKKVYTGSVEV